MASGGARARSGPAPDPLSRTSLLKGRDWVELPAGGWTGDVPEWPFPDSPGASMWADVWRKPQAMMWSRLGLADQVAAYVVAYLESVAPEASAGLKTAVLRMETELGISVAGMRQNGWVIGSVEPEPDEPPAAKAGRRTSTGTWLEGVTVEGA